MHYRLIEVLGKGGMSTVYLGEDQNDGKQVAVKKFKLPSNMNYSEALFRLKQEATVVSGLSHPNIIRVHNFQEKENSLFMIMEYFDGKNLKQVAQSLSLIEKVKVMQIVAEALGYVHNKKRVMTSIDR